MPDELERLPEGYRPETCWACGGESRSPKSTCRICGGAGQTLPEGTGALDYAALAARLLCERDEALREVERLREALLADRYEMRQLQEALELAIEFVSAHGDLAETAGDTGAAESYRRLQKGFEAALRGEEGDDA